MLIDLPAPLDRFQAKGENMRFCHTEGLTVL